MTDVDRPRSMTVARSPLKSVALPSEHGGWGLTAEPAILGLAVAPSVPALALAIVAFTAFLARTPLKVLLVDRHRGRSLERTGLARRVLAVEAFLATGLLVIATLTASAAFWWPMVVALPLVATELWFDMRSRSRRLVPELAGASGIAAIAAMSVLAAGHPSGEASAAWLVLVARAFTSIPHVRAQIQRRHGRTTPAGELLAADAAAIAVAAGAVLADPGATAGAVAVAGLVVVQRVTMHTDAPVKVIGVRQTILGLAVVTATAAGLRLA